MSEDNVFYVYLHRKKDNNEVFYVGKGKDRRAYQKSGRNNWWKRIVDKHDFIPEIVEKDLSEEDAFELEIELIKFYKENGHILCNITNGGEGASYKMPECMRNKIVERWKCPNFRERMKEKSGKSVICSNGMIFKTASEAERWIGKDPSKSKQINACCRREIYCAHGYVWRYVNDCEDLKEMLDKGLDAYVEWNCQERLDKNTKKAKTVYCNNGMIFRSCISAMEWFHSHGKTSVKATFISRCCAGKRNRLWGLKFSYEDVFGPPENVEIAPVRVYVNEHSNFKEKLMETLNKNLSVDEIRAKLAELDN